MEIVWIFKYENLTVETIIIRVLILIVSVLEAFKYVILIIETFEYGVFIFILLIIGTFVQL
jgi:hypothetical protein